MDIHFLRHGQTDRHLKLRIQGRGGIPLNETGRTQRAKPRRNSRARDIAPIIGTARGIGDVKAVEELREHDFGGLEGLTNLERNVYTVNIMPARLNKIVSVLPDLCGQSSKRLLISRKIRRHSEARFRGALQEAKSTVPASSQSTETLLRFSSKR